MEKSIIGIIGLGYVGLPLAVEFGKKYKTIGLDINDKRVKEINQCYDRTNEVSGDELRSALSGSNGLFVTNDMRELLDCDFYIITVPTPVDRKKNPDFNPLIKASQMVGDLLKKGNYVIYESTVYPGATEEICLPILSQRSGLELNKDFFLGYSPERINPGDKTHTLTKIKKVTSGSCEAAASTVDNLYDSIITAGTFKAASIKVAEAAKVIENTQRDINIAFINELSKICSLIGISVYDVLDAASTKWNFLNFKPGLVGGHCIGVDPYYLAERAKEFNYYHEIILAGRRINESMGDYVGDLMIRSLIEQNIEIHNSKILILGITFKENCPDIRNTGVINVYNRLKSFNLKVDVHDPLADPNEVRGEYGIALTIDIKTKYSGIIIAVAHDQFKDLKIADFKEVKSVVLDLKNISHDKDAIRL